MKYHIVSSNPIENAGKMYPTGKPIAIIESDFDASQLESLIQYKQAFISVIKYDEPEPIAVPKSKPDSVSDTPTNESPDSEPLPDPAQAKASEVSRADLAASEFPGLDTRIALAFMDQGIPDPETLRAKIDGGLDLIDLDQIGRAAKKKAIEWLDSVLPPAK